MNLSLKGKKAVVCGSTQGIGKAIALKLAHQGASITLLSRDEDKLKKTLNQLSISNDQIHDYIVSDFNNLEDLKIKFKNYLNKNHKPTILINNTGGPPPGGIAEAKISNFKNYMSMHLYCSHFLTQSLLPIMEKEEFGRIVNIISISVKSPIDNLGVSNTVRWAMASWAKTLSNEVAIHGVTVNNVLPGFTMTERLKKLIEQNANSHNKSVKEIEKEFKSKIPMNRFGLPEEIASSVSFLCSKEAAYINGINLPVDGGFTKSL